jgi:hypothetical protein
LVKPELGFVVIGAELSFEAASWEKAEPLAPMINNAISDWVRTVRR